MASSFAMQSNIEYVLHMLNFIMNLDDLNRLLFNV